MPAELTRTRLKPFCSAFVTEPEMRSAPSSIGMEMGVGRGRHDTGTETAAKRSRRGYQFRLIPRLTATRGARPRAVRHRLTLYEAAYLGAGVAAGFALATLDRDSRTAARAQDAQLLGL